MSDKDLQDTLDALDSLKQEIGDSPEKAMAFLVEAGIVTASGELTEPYRQLA